MPAIRERGWRLPEGVEPSAEHVEQNDILTKWMDMMASTGQTYCETYEEQTDRLDATLAVPLSDPVPTLSGQVIIQYNIAGQPNQAGYDRSTFRRKMEEIQYQRDPETGRHTPASEQGEVALAHLKEMGFEVIPGGLYRYDLRESSRRRYRDNIGYRRSDDRSQDRYLRF